MKIITVIKGGETPQTISSPYIGYLEAEEGGNGDGSDGGYSAPNDIAIPVNTNGQTQFNIFSIPSVKTELIINHAIYQQTDDYTFGMNGLNAVLIWKNEFPISITDTIIFRKY